MGLYRPFTGTKPNTKSVGEVFLNFAVTSGFPLARVQCCAERSEQFDTDDTSQHYTLFPLAPAQIPRYRSSISILDNGTKTAGDTQASLVTDTRWKVLQNSLLGLFCASLGSTDVPHTTSLAHAFPPSGNFPRPHTMHTPYAMPHSSRSAYHGTENLKPFLKFLPCPKRAGVAALLEPHRAFDARSPTGMVWACMRAGAPTRTEPYAAPADDDDNTRTVTTTTNTTVALGSGNDDDRNEDGSDPGHRSGCPASGPADADAALNRVWWYFIWKRRVRAPDQAGQAASLSTGIACLSR
ncbi:Gpi16 subunit, GPI transamidase component-domain-containing protein [Lactarius pseudohatsudake]|nr:Gpi16 subunit, GPI transamidase component-domain-containing protein [Lactarius pseudohatsudake]